MLRDLFKNLIAETCLEAEAAAARHRASAEGQRFDWRFVAVCLIGAVCLTCAYYLRNVQFLAGVIEAAFGSAAARNVLTAISDTRLTALLYWAGTALMFFGVAPLLAVPLVLRRPLSEFGIVAAGAFKDGGIYALLVAAVAPLVLAFSFTPSFQATYPFYAPPSGGALSAGFLLWEFAYFLQFVGIEFFFRGFLLNGLKTRLGYYAVFAAVIPYCMIHFGKPLPETLGSIIAGVALGHMSLRSRSILPGILVHYSVALMMDLAALWQRGLL